jgi:nucleotide-binding universal stress UspA family protein
LLFVRGWQMDSAYDDAIVDPSVVEDWRQRYVDEVQARVTSLRRRRTTVPWSAEVVHARPHEALTAASRDVGTLVLGRGGVDLPLVGRLGSVTRATMRDSLCPVEVVHQTPNRSGDGSWEAEGPAAPCRQALPAR